VLFGAWEQTSATGFLFTLPEAVWEFSLGVYLIVKGFKTTSRVLDDGREGALEDAFSPAAAAG
jgi:hypothetical protein